MSESSSETHIGDGSDGFEEIESPGADIGSEELVRLQVWFQPTDGRVILCGTLLHSYFPTALVSKGQYIIFWRTNAVWMTLFLRIAV